MKSLSLILILLSGILICCNRKSCPPSKEPTNMGPTVEYKDEKLDIISGNNQFAFDLYSKIKTESDNLFFSPFSISSALAMTYGGAEKETKNQMSSTLHFATDREAFHSEFNKLIMSLDQIGGVQLNVANSLWAQKGFIFLKDYLDLIKEHYKSEVNIVDFKKDSEKCRIKINQWVEDETNEKIQDLLKPGMVNSGTRLVLTNAIYFLGNWARQFEEKHTEKSTFIKADRDNIEVPFMNEFSEDYYYLKNDFMKILELPYKKKRLSMIIMLPNSNTDMKKLENSLTIENYNKWISSLSRLDVNHVSIPKFKFTGEFSLGEILADMGMPMAFSDRADFSGMTGKLDLKIDKVIHKAFVEVNERGTEAAAATAVTMIETTAMPGEEEIITFIADHPFIFLIRDKHSNSILFIGKVMDPSL